MGEIITSDPTPQEYFDSADETRAGELLSALLFHQAEPVIRRIVNHRLGFSATPQDREDVRGEVMLDLIARLQQHRRSPGPGGIENFPGYVAVAAYHACDRFYRQRFPQRHRLKNRLRYLLENDRRFAIWEAGAEWLCGLALWDGRRAQPLNTALTGVTLAPEGRPADAVEAVFRHTESPIALNDLVDLLARYWDIRDQQTTLDALPQPPATVNDVDAGLDRRRDLALLWSEIVQLPAAQRVALLLHLRDDRGASALLYLLPSGVATLPQIAGALEIAPAELAALWARLPLSDLEIAERLQLTRQQVINLRQSARQRLNRRREGTRNK